MSPGPTTFASTQWTTAPAQTDNTRIIPRYNLQWLNPSQGEHLNVEHNYLSAFQISKLTLSNAHSHQLTKKKSSLVHNRPLTSCLLLLHSSSSSTSAWGSESSTWGRTRLRLQSPLHSRYVARLSDLGVHRLLVQPLASANEHATAVAVLRVRVDQFQRLMQRPSHAHTRPATASSFNLSLWWSLERRGHDDRVAVRDGLIELLEGATTDHQHLVASGGAENAQSAGRFHGNLPCLPITRFTEHATIRDTGSLRCPPAVAMLGNVTAASCGPLRVSDTKDGYKNLLVKFQACLSSMRE